jgi:hypothetical protein
VGERGRRGIHLSGVPFHQQGTLTNVIPATFKASSLLSQLHQKNKNKNKNKKLQKKLDIIFSSHGIQCELRIPSGHVVVIILILLVSLGREGGER